ncbi:hypothetical protein HMPREF1624_02406 [Sporothrix schenckii ATCC 58251]|uniref:Rhodopsin domain-containing protein n=1 Tax=Sporothrix schenckii (strain ATCC 58251 / de Perez 2211183) TaxID=1391915 RepID=U7PZT0_SPOS1|nr:hypothetical protein HMPREF1624_02406 [Sporothrix schenckii ATCC 58251]
MADNSTVLPPLKAVTDTDQGGILAIAASLGLVFGVISLLIRTYVRIECRAAFGKDDYAAFLSMVVALIQGVLVFLAISNGFGKVVADLTSDAILAWQRDLYISDIFFLVGMWLTKSSIALLLMRLSRDPSHSVMARILLVASAVYFVVSIFVVAIRCDLSQPWNDAVPGCSATTYARWAAVTVMDVLVEIALFIGGVWLVRDLQLPWSKKSVVVVAYGLRLPVILAAAVRLYYLRQSLYSNDESLHGILAYVCTQTELAYAVIATTMPCLKPFMSALNTGYGGGGTFVLTTTSPNASNLQRSRDTTGGHSTYGKAKAAAVAVMSGGVGGGNGSSNGGAGAGSRSASKVRDSTESQTRILSGNDNKNGGGNGTDSESGHLSRPATNNSEPPQAMPKLAPSQTQYVPTQVPSKASAFASFKTTKAASSTATATKSPFGGRSRMSTVAPEYVVVTTDTTVQEERTDNAALQSTQPAEPAEPIAPVSPIYAQYSRGGGQPRIGHAE